MEEIVQKSGYFAPFLGKKYGSSWKRSSPN